jgi:DNA repair exonuclease SbcCD ATPase subunit
MRTNRLLFLPALLTIFLLYSGTSFAQLDKPERRTYKKMKRKMPPEDFKKLLEDKARFSASTDSLTAETENLLRTLRERDSSLQRTREAEARLSQQLSELRQQLADLETQEASNEWDQGVAFRVQLGAFEDHDISELVADSPDLDLVKEDGFNKFVLGQFRTYEKADELKKYLRKIGVKETWIVPYKDGKRVPLKSVMEELAKGK